ncbi:hypothetical protein NYE24_32630 [Paenibacillus sp. FSL H7-0350]
MLLADTISRNLTQPDGITAEGSGNLLFIDLPIVLPVITFS